MCKFKSGIVTRSGEIYTHWNTDSHEELITYYKLNDKGLDYLVRVEYAPEDIKDLADVSKYVLRVDEHSIPAWFEEQREHVESEMRHIIERMIKTDGDIELILDGEYILAGKSKTTKIKGGRILSISGNAQVEYIAGNAQVKSIHDNAQVKSISENAQVKSIYGNAQVEYIFGNAQVESISGNAQVEYIYGNAQVEYISGNAQVEYIAGNAQVEHICGNAQVEYIFGNAQVKNDKRAK